MTFYIFYIIAFCIRTFYEEPSIEMYFRAIHDRGFAASQLQQYFYKGGRGPRDEGGALGSRVRPGAAPRRGGGEEDCKNADDRSGNGETLLNTSSSASSQHPPTCTKSMSNWETKKEV